MSCPKFSAQGLRGFPSLLIREARKKADLTRAALAARLRISPARPRPSLRSVQLDAPSLFLLRSALIGGGSVLNGR